MYSGLIVLGFSVIHIYLNWNSIKSYLGAKRSR
ncbi:MAG: hypothetical protein DRN30_04815 [Thermoplasmata archaeon]|nr:MAG: hypothetical protein DRN30_04815 [Thermoplasmata archaeon]